MHMSAQMRLIEIEEGIPAWALDRRTREVGLKGVAAARAVLQSPSSSKAQNFSRPNRNATDFQLKVTSSPICDFATRSTE